MLHPKSIGKRGKKTLSRLFNIAILIITLFQNLQKSLSNNYKSTNKARATKPHAFTTRPEATEDFGVEVGEGEDDVVGFAPLRGKVTLHPTS
jgi:hypothetical protein